MKTLKFVPELCNLIIAGTKTATWRFFDDKNLQLGDDLIFLNKETMKQFGTAKITSLYTKTLGTLVDSDWVGHEKFETEQKMYETYKTYYGDKITPDTIVTIVRFDFLKN